MSVYSIQPYVGCVINGNQYYMFKDGLRKEGLLEDSTPVERRRARHHLRACHTINFKGTIIAPFNHPDIKRI